MRTKSLFYILFILLCAVSQANADDIPIPDNKPHPCMLIDYGLSMSYPESTCTFVGEKEVNVVAGAYYRYPSRMPFANDGLRVFKRTLSLYSEFPATISTAKSYYAKPNDLDMYLGHTKVWSVKLYQLCAGTEDDYSC